MKRGAVPVPLTPMQRRFMLALQSRLESRPDVGPTYEELRIDMGLASRSGIARLVKECEQRGRIRRRPYSERSLEIVNPVLEDEFTAEHRPLIESFSDKEIILEASRRGLVQVRGLSD